MITTDESGLDHLERLHLVAVRVDMELRAERLLEKWYQDNPDRMGIPMDDLYGEHKVRLALLESLAR